MRKRPAGPDERRICLLLPQPSNRGMKLFYEGKKRKEDLSRGQHDARATVSDQPVLARIAAAVPFDGCSAVHLARKLTILTGVGHRVLARSRSPPSS